jgi:hypothetical protein
LNLSSRLSLSEFTGKASIAGEFTNRSHSTPQEHRQGRLAVFRLCVL